jgi:hypothetical protein
MNNQDCLTQVFFYSVLIAVSFYVPLQYMARKLELRLGMPQTLHSRIRAIGVMYGIGYIPLVLLLLVTCINESLFPLGAVFFLSWLSIGIFQVKRMVNRRNYPDKNS